MPASCLVVLWHKILLSPPVWFLVEIVSKKPWKWSLYSSVALTSFIPILALTAFTLGAVLSGFIVLFLLQCGLLSLAIASFVSSVTVLVPAALTVTLSIYLIYKSAVMAWCALCWMLALPKRMLTRIKQQVNSVSSWVSDILNNLCFWKSRKRKRRKDKNSEEQAKAGHRARKRNSPHSLDSDNYTCHSRNRSKGWFSWLNEDSDSNISSSDRNVIACPHGYILRLSRNKRYYELACKICTGGRSASSSSSDNDRIRFSSGSSSDSYHTADEWLLEDFAGNIIPDYRDRETKMYEALLKRDFCTGAEGNNYY